MEYGNHYLDPHPDDDAELHGPPDFDAAKENLDAFVGMLVWSFTFYVLYCLVPA